MSNYNDEIRFKDLILILVDYKNYLLSKAPKIILIILLSFFITLTFYKIKDQTYKAILTFVVEDSGKNSVAGLSSLGGLVGQMGIDLGGAMGSATFNQQNILELLKSRGVIVSALMNRQIINNKSTLLIDHYTLMNNFDPRLIIENEKNNYHIDSLSNYVWKHILSEDNLSVEVSAKSNIISLSYESKDEKFSKYFVERLIDETINLYIEHQTTRAVASLDFLQERADSVFEELEMAEKKYATIKDVNDRIIKASGRLQELQLMRQVEVLNTMYLEIVKNLELSKLTLLDQTPLINIIDQPVIPLDKQKKDIKWYLFFITFLGFFMAVIYFVGYKFLTDLLKD
jgi:uncharacterized protein involved in exopolysaccharide biosynthesis